MATTLSQMKESLDRGEFGLKYTEVVVDNDHAVLKVWPSVSDADDDQDPTETIRLNYGTTLAVEALLLLGFNARGA